MKAYVAVVILAVTMAACGGATNQCSSLLEAYDAEFQAALACDPQIANQCAVQRPVVVAEQSAGGRTLEGLASNCTHAVNGDQTARLDSILSEYTSGHCKSLPIPICQLPMTTCELSSNGMHQCAP